MQFVHAKNTIQSCHTRVAHAKNTAHACIFNAFIKRNKHHTCILRTQKIAYLRYWCISIPSDFGYLHSFSHSSKKDKSWRRTGIIHEWILSPLSWAKLLTIREGVALSSGLKSAFKSRVGAFFLKDRLLLSFLKAFCEMGLTLSLSSFDPNKLLTYPHDLFSLMFLLSVFLTLSLFVVVLLIDLRLLL